MGIRREAATHKVVTQVGSRDSECPHRADDEHRTGGEENTGEDLELAVGEDGEGRLVGESEVVPFEVQSGRQSFVGVLASRNKAERNTRSGLSKRARRESQEDVQVITKDTEGEDSESESVASPIRPTESELSEDLRTVLCEVGRVLSEGSVVVVQQREQQPLTGTSDDVPEQRVL